MSAVISQCGRWRYRLTRETGLSGPTLTVVMVNPSTADETKDDATIRKVLGFARRLGAGRVVVGNLFALRATDVRDLRHAPDPVGPENDEHIRAMMCEAEALLFAWGPATKVPPIWRGRWREVQEMARVAGKRPMCLGVAKCGHPRHPLMVPYAQPFEWWDGAWPIN